MKLSPLGESMIRTFIASSILVRSEVLNEYVTLRYYNKSILVRHCSSVHFSLTFLAAQH